jgi:hypothetical protein
MGMLSNRLITHLLAAATFNDATFKDATFYHFSEMISIVM